MSIELLGLNIDNYSFDEAITIAKELIDGQKVSHIVTINPEMFAQAEKDAEFANIIKEAEMVIPDGVGIKIASLLIGKNIQRIPGIDFARKLLEEVALIGIPVAIIGAKKDVIENAVKNLQREIPELNIVYAHDGYFDDPNKIYEDLKIKSPKLILAALGSPKQERFIYNAKKILNPALMIGIGGSLDVWSGQVKRAPKIFQIIGLEWLYRTITQPQRFKRIFPALPMFLLKVISSNRKEF